MASGNEDEASVSVVLRAGSKPRKDVIRVMPRGVDRCRGGLDDPARQWKISESYYVERQFWRQDIEPMGMLWR
jgi:hypothetical protein